MKNCFDCKHCVSKHTGLMNPQENQEFLANIHDWVMLKPPTDFKGTHIGMCLKGFNNKMKTFKLEHIGSKREDLEKDRTLDMDCHENTDTVQMLQTMIDKVYELGDKLTLREGNENS